MIFFLTFSEITSNSSFVKLNFIHYVGIWLPVPLCISPPWFSSDFAYPLLKYTLVRKHFNNYIKILKLLRFLEIVIFVGVRYAQDVFKSCYFCRCPVCAEQADTSFAKLSDMLRSVLENYNKKALPMRDGKPFEVSYQVFIEDMIPLEPTNMVKKIWIC